MLSFIDTIHKKSIVNITGFRTLDGLTNGCILIHGERTIRIGIRFYIFFYAVLSLLSSNLCDCR